MSTTMTIIASVLIIFGLTGIFINGSQFYYLRKLHNEIRKEQSESIEPDALNGMAPFVEHNKSLLIMSLAMLAIGLFIVLR